MTTYPRRFSFWHVATGGIRTCVRSQMSGAPPRPSHLGRTSVSYFFHALVLYTDENRSADLLIHCSFLQLPTAAEIAPVLLIRIAPNALSNWAEFYRLVSVKQPVKQSVSQSACSGETDSPGGGSSPAEVSVRTLSCRRTLRAATASVTARHAAPRCFI